MLRGDKIDERKARGTQGADSQGSGRDLTGADADCTAAGQARMVLLRAVLPLVVTRAVHSGTAIVLRIVLGLDGTTQVRGKKACGRRG
jgi:hypothetical protein